MDGNIIKNCSNFIEKSCNDVTKNIIGGFTSPVDNTIKKNLEKIATGVLETNDVKTNYIFLGYEMSTTVFIILMIVLLIITLYIIFKLYNWFFVSPTNELVTIKKYKKDNTSSVDILSENNEDDENDGTGTEDA
jgi:hypothetical protein